MKRLFKLSACTLVLSLFISFGISQSSISFANVSGTDSNTTKVEENVINNSKGSGFVPVSTVKTLVSSNKNCNTGNKPILLYKNVNLSQCKSVKDVVKTLRKNGYTNINMKNVKNINALKNILAVIKSNGAAATPAATATPTPSKTPAGTKTPVVTPAPSTNNTSSTSNSSNMSSYAKEVLRLVNIEREKAGLTPYTTTTSLTSAANKRAQETKQSFSHTRPNGTGFQTVLGEFGVSYRAAGENIAYGQKTPQEVVTGWMNSPGHRANILNANFSKIGIGVYESNGVIYWTQEFTN